MPHMVSDKTMGVYLEELINKAYNSFDDSDNKKGGNGKPKQVNPVADKDKYQKRGGDI